MNHAHPAEQPIAPITGPVLVLEDLALPRRWLCELLRQAWPAVGWVDEAHNLHQAMQMSCGRVYQVALVDWELPDGNAGALIEHLSTTAPETLVVVSTIHDDDERVFAALKAGAQGYILKSQSAEQVLAQLHALARGEPALSPAIAHKVLAYFRKQGALRPPTHPPPESGADDGHLTPRESDVLRLLAKGYRNAEASQMLGISAHTLGGYIKTVYRKLGVSSRAEAALQAVRLGLTE